MSYLLSNIALVDLVSQNTAMVNFAKQAPHQSIQISAVSVGLLHAEIDSLPPASNSKFNLLNNLDAIAQRVAAYNGIRDVNLDISKTWASFDNLALVDSSGDALGVESKLVIATAMTARLLLVTPLEPWVPILKARGLNVHIY